MAGTLILDAEAVNALARARERGALAERARAILQVAHEDGALVHVPAPVLAEVCRGGGFDAPVRQLLNGRGIGVVDLTERAARRAGGLAGSGGDPDDLRRLAKNAPSLRILAI